MPIEPVKIPQNVYVEDRIIGPVTLKQLAIVGVGAGISYAMFSTASRGGSISIPYGVLLWTPAMIAAAFAFLKINDLSLFNIILLGIEHSNKPDLRFWSSHPGISINFVSKAAKQAVIDANTKITENAGKLAELTRQLERREEELSKLANHTLTTTTPSETAPPPTSGNRRLDGINAMHEAAGAPAKAAQSPAAPAAPVTIASISAPIPAAPVQQNRVQAQGLNPAASIDGIAAKPAASTEAAAAAAEDAQTEAEFQAEIDAADKGPSNGGGKKALDAFKHIFPSQN